MTHELDDQAPYWAVRIGGAPLSNADQTALKAWLGADDRHAGALLRAEAALALVDRAQALGPIAPTLSTSPGAVSRRGILRASAAGTAAIAAGVAGFALRPRGMTMTTRIGERRRVRLADSSHVTINTDSQLSAFLGERERLIRLDRGEAWFEVAHDRSRPFTVSAGDLRVRAIGTAFSVRRFAGGTDVLVTDGVVEAWREGRATKSVCISSGRRSFVSDEAVAIVPVKAGVEIERALAWRAGGLALDGEPLDYAVAELNRYNERKLRIEDPVLGRTAIVGYFEVDDPERFARSVGALVGAAVEYDAQGYRLVMRSS